MSEFWVQFFLVTEATLLGFFIFMAIYELFTFFRKLEKAEWAFPVFSFVVILAVYTLMSGQTRVLFRSWDQTVIDRILHFSLSLWIPAMVVIIWQSRKDVVPMPVTWVLGGGGLLFAIGAWPVPSTFLPDLNLVRLFFFLLAILILVGVLIRSWKNGGKNEAVLTAALFGLGLALGMDLANNLQGTHLLKFKPYGAAFFCVLFMWDRFSFQSAERKQAVQDPSKELPGNLTTREKEIAGLLLEGLSYKEIAGKLFISEKTVNIHIQKIYRKTGVKSRAKLSSFMKTLPKAD